MEAFEIPPGVLKPSTPARVIELIGKALAANPPPSRRAELVRNLGECRLPAGVPAVVGAMADPDATVRAEAARACAMIGDPSGIKALEELLKDSDPAVRAAAIRAGASLNQDSFVTAGLGDSNQDCFMAAAPHASGPAHFELIAARMASLSGSARCVAARALSRSASMEHAALVASQLSGDNVPLIVVAIESLAKSKAVLHADSVRAMLSHPHPTVRRAAVRSMRVFAEGVDQAAIATKALADEDLSVRQAACELLNANPTQEAIPVLAQQLSAGYRPLRLAAREALISGDAVAQEQVRNVAAAMLSDVDHDRRIDGSYILGHLKSDVAFERHLQLLDDGDWVIVQQVVESLGEIGRTEAAERIVKIAKRAQPDEAAGASAPNEPEAIGAAFVACGKLHYKPIFRLAREIVPQKLTSPIAIRSRAIWAAGVLGAADDGDLASALLSVANDNSPYENELARFEAIKALGNQHHLAALEELQRQSREQSIPSLRWIAYLVARRLQGGNASEPYTPPTLTHIAETSIQDLSQ